MVRVLQLSDPHLLADPSGRCRGRVALGALAHAWQQCLRQQGERPELLLISGDLCQDESLGGYVRLRELLELWDVPVALLPGNHDHPALLRAALGRRAWIAPAVVPLGHWRVLLLSTHRSGAVAGWIEAPQLAWLEQQLAVDSSPALVALHHPPVAIGHPELDRIALQVAECAVGDAGAVHLVMKPLAQNGVIGMAHADVINNQITHHAGLFAANVDLRYRAKSAHRQPFDHTV